MPIGYNENTETIRTYDLHVDKWMANRGPALPEPFAKPLRAFLAHFEPGARILEIGSGPGYTAEHVARLNYTFVPTDAAVSFITIMQNRGHRAFQYNVLTEPIPNEKYQGIWAGAVFHHFTNQQFETAARRVFIGLKPGGWFGLTVRYGLDSFWDDRLGGRRFYQPQSRLSLLAKLRNLGFTSHENGEFTDDNGEKWVYVIVRRPHAKTWAVTASTNATSFSGQQWNT